MTLLTPNYAGQPNLKVEQQWFNADYWESQRLIVGQSSGRHTTWFIRPNMADENNDWVLRHYYRGGMIAKLSRDRFFYSGISKTRPFLEMALLIEMHQMNLPVPICVGAKVERRGLSYQADLLMKKIDASDLVKLLSTGSLPSKLWHKLGQVIAKFHQSGIYHADLNAHNLMIDDNQKIWIIDFDRCEKRKPSTDWQQQNIARLKRSMIKEKGLNQKFDFDQANWDELLKGYASNILKSDNL